MTWLKLALSQAPGDVIRRIPFTLGMVFILRVVAWGTHSFFKELAP